MNHLYSRRRRLFLAGLVLFAALLAASVFLSSGAAQQIHRNPFESAVTSWVKGPADVAYTEKKHVRSNMGPQAGQRCEYIDIDAQKNGSYVYYLYPTGKAPITEELRVGLHLKSHRRGAQLLARVVLPHARDPRSPNDRFITYIRGDTYRLKGRWQKLVISQPVKLAQRQQQHMQNQLKRAIDFKDAYVDAVVLNVYAGAGRNETWVDNLEIGPVFVSSAQTVDGGKTPKDSAPGQRPSPRRAAAVTFSASHLLVGGKRFFFRGIRHSDTPLSVLRNAGFNAVWLPYSAKQELAREAAQLGFWIVPSFPLAARADQLVSRNSLGQEIARYPEADAVLFWDFGGALVFEQAALVARSARVVRAVDNGRPVGADVWDGFLPYSRSLNLVGAHRWPLMTELGLDGYREWLNQRRLLGNPNTFMWTWVQNHTPDFFARLLYDQSAGEAFQYPVGPQPAQIRLLTYTALCAGYRSLGFWSDRFLADSHQGRDRLLGAALLNQELEMLQPLLVNMEGAPDWVKTKNPNVQAAVFRAGKNILILPMWLGKGAQYVPGQQAAAQLKIVVPPVPPGMQAWEVTPGEVRSLKSNRVYGGTEIVLPDFGLTTAIVCTSDRALIERLQTHCRYLRLKAAQYAYDQAVNEIRKVQVVQNQLQKQGRQVKQADFLLSQANARLTLARQNWDNRFFGDAYREAQRALRPVRILMRAQWNKATEALDAPVSVPYAVSYYTLPKFWQFAADVQQTSPGTNVLPGGDFEATPDGQRPGWTPLNLKSLDKIVKRSEIVGKGTPSSSGRTVEAKQGKLCAMLEIAPSDKKARIGALERTYLAYYSPEVRLQPNSLVRISGWIHIPKPIEASVDGVLFFDNIGGEPLAIRLRQKTPWKKFSLYRRVPANGVVRVTLALSGIGVAYFDDIRIEPLK